MRNESYERLEISVESENMLLKTKFIVISGSILKTVELLKYCNVFQ